MDTLNEGKGPEPPSADSKQTVTWMMVTASIAGICCLPIAPFVFSHYRTRYGKRDRFVGFYATQGLYLVAIPFFVYVVAFFSIYYFDNVVYDDLRNLTFEVDGEPVAGETVAREARDLLRLAARGIVAMFVLAYLVCVIMMLVKARSGELFELPFIGRKARKNAGV